ncbi:lycopene cyclase family protein [Amycolatopsis saalfeldensis]|uniref:Lycopene cyclase (CrtL-type) n=1 Tax=Amycolatopsis saalfeldensis TaxID=394193 RepID=A0A1H8XWN6_9PSEU|nr:lycopene cyclase family protein [Amycolatopsis saalfeldensis]SEP44181.1 lycopene cyclase (CrtL-type) [Amycolatopsis saalfeldensis]
MADVLIAGGGPAGWALARACARRGLATTVVDPAPHRPWRNTYGVWSDELPGLPAGVIAAAPSATVAFGTREHRLDRGYLVLDNEGLRSWLTGERVHVVTGQAAAVESGRHGATVVLTDDRRLAAAVVVDASGASRVLFGGKARGARAEQTAYGLVLPAAEAERLGPGAAGTAVFMDWRGGGPSFRYQLPLGDGSVLVEETSLARRPGLPVDELARRLRARLAAAGVRGRYAVAEERVRIVLDVPLPGRGAVVPFGVAAGLVHPATGYSLATSLRLAPPVAAAIAAAFDAGPPAAARAAKRTLWTPEARTVHSLRRHGLHALCGMPPGEPAEFFDLFFTLPPTAQRAFTSGRDDLPGTAAAMTRLFRAAPPGLRARLAGLPPVREAPG